MFNKQTLTCLAGALAVASAATKTTSTSTVNEYPTTPEVQASAATVQPESPTSNVRGLAFNRFVNIWFENTDYSTAAQDPNFSKFASEGILLSNYFAVTHPSEPNYCTSAGGDNFGMDNDNWQQVPANISTIADLFDTKKISWGEYQQDLPYAGYQGFRWPESGPNEYVRKHNPLVIFDSVAQSSERLRQIKNFTSFYNDLNAQTLPQHSFITPNMTNDAHDTNVTFAGNFLNNFLSPLLANEYFTKDTLVLVTFDENSAYPSPNRVYSFLVGGAVPDNLKGTTDDTFYTHYSVIATLSANWGLPSLGRWDCGANLFQLVSNKTGYTNWNVDLENVYLNHTYPGPLSANVYSTYSPNWPAPATSGQCSSGNGILPLVHKNWSGHKPTYNYTSPVPYDSVSGTNTGIKYSRTLPNGSTESHVTE